MFLALTIIHVVISIALVAVVLLQEGKQQGLSGAIAGGAETFFGKNKSRTLDSMFKKLTAVLAALFIISSLALAAVAVVDYNNSLEAESAQTEVVEGEAVEGEVVEGEAVEGEVVEGEAVEGEAVEGEAVEGEAVEGEAVEGEAVEGETTEAPAAE